MSESPHLQRASILSQQGRHELAEKELRAYLAEAPTDGVGHGLLAVTLNELERWDEAEEAARSAIGYGPELPFAHYALAVILLDRRKWEESVVAAEEALRLDPGQPEVYGTIAAAEFGRREWQKALEAAERGLAFDAEHVTCNNLRAMALVRLGRKSEAGATMDATLARDPHDSVSHANMGWTKLEQGKRQEAMEHFREALRLDPDNDWARSGLVEAIKAGNPIYAVMLKYFLWMGKLSSQTMWMIIVGGYIGYRFLRELAEDPRWTPWVMPLIIAYVGFVLLSWLAAPLFDLALFLHPMGKHALDDDARTRATLVGGALGVAVVSGGLSFVAPVSYQLVVLALVSGLLSIPLSAIHVCAEGWPRRAMASIAGGLATVGLSAWVGLGLLQPAEESAGETLALAALILFFLGIFISQFAANWLATRQPAR